MAEGEGCGMRERCSGWVQTLKGEKVLLTGAIYIKGEHVVRKKVGDRIALRGGTFVPRFNSSVTAVICGDLTGKNVVDVRRHLSEKLLEVEEQIRRGKHVHVVDQAGFDLLLDGFPARCRVHSGPTDV
ncbi:hypothetical protein BIV57_15825 [Mangrovactinospora gilvigrisea]|uniref:BRCT domain-containing protein n=1 Tax=Mangrovactinospora gilvigrisea TaxID=1428644 RepID=A0A1J7C4M8_9ACTN|nr:hypothetical protein [Mangrovactinospora gilvigrisea]OIV36516.1 hypothetical protein BIV57_15825 [Mangrovactinospora gilvigrisea]